MKHYWQWTKQVMMMSDYKPQIPLSDLRYIWSEAAVYAVRTWDGQGNYRQEVRKHFRRYMESAVLSGLQEELSRRAKEIDALRAQLATLQAATPVGLTAPDSEGWWIFRGSEKGFKPIYELDGVEYEEWNPEWDEAQEEHWHRYELHWVEISRYEDILEEPFHAVYQVVQARTGHSVTQYRQSGPYKGEPFFGYLKSNGWSSGIHHPNLLVGKWYKLHMPWNATNGGQDAKR